jgi:hypothetical protein
VYQIELDRINMRLYVYISVICVLNELPLLHLATDLKNGSGDIYPGEPKQGKPGCTLTLSDDDLQALVQGKLNPQKVRGSFMSIICMVWGRSSVQFSSILAFLATCPFVHDY